MLQRSRLNRILSLGIIGISLFTGVAEARSPLTFKPPKRGAPPITGGSASRSASCIPGIQTMQSVMPPNNFGLTTAARPNLLVYVPSASAQAIEVEIETADGRQVVSKQTFAAPTAPGIVRLDLNAGNPLPLSLDKPYQWFVTLVCDMNDRSNDATISGWVQRTRPDATLQTQLTQRPRANHPALYAEAGVWYDTLTHLDDLRQSRPNDPQLSTDWKTLLKSVKLDAIAPAPRINLP